MQRQSQASLEHFRVLLPVNRSAERGQRIQIRRRVVTDHIDRPCAEQEKRSSDGDDGSPDHGAAPCYSCAFG